MEPSTSKHFSDSGVSSTFFSGRLPLLREFRLNERFLGGGIRKCSRGYSSSHGPELLSDVDDSHCKS